MNFWHSGIDNSAGADCREVPAPLGMSEGQEFVANIDMAV